MACFSVPAAEAVVVGVTYLIVKHNENKVTVKAHADSESSADNTTVKFSRKLGWLFNLLFGGSFLLAFEHLWHGEVVPWFPFLTAMADPTSKAQMLHEISTTGVAMALSVTAVWVVMLVVSHIIETRKTESSVFETEKE